MDAMSMNRYWIPQWNIHKKIVFQELHYYLGPQATARSYTLDVSTILVHNVVPKRERGRKIGGTDTSKGEDGYLISTPGPCLSDVRAPPHPLWQVAVHSRADFDKKNSGAVRRPVPEVGRLLVQPGGYEKPEGAREETEAPDAPARRLVERRGAFSQEEMMKPRWGGFQRSEAPMIGLIWPIYSISVGEEV